ncbi:MAG: serine/threonine protein kinase, partial [Planctomycetes bacterium]|nr:serine/threonine protein kinase [Planctomycetota bacterium]
MSTHQNPGGSSSTKRERDLIQAALADASVMGQTADVPPPRLRADNEGEFTQPPSDSFKSYDITREIHRGGQGVVYQGIHKATKRKVAIKVMREGPFAGPKDKARFEREVQILAQLNHPNIVTVLDSGQAAGSFYFVMDYISGQSLDKYVAGRNPSINETLELFVKICEAVNAAHLRGVIHRDLKPGNIRVDTEGAPHIVDFGLAKVATSSMTDETTPQIMTVTGQFVGSLPWASPEQAEGITSKIDVRTDVYSLGVILYQLLTGKFPYEVIGNMRDILENIVKVAPARPSTIRRKIDDEVETIVLKALAKDRDRRYQSAGELARDIKHYLAGEPIEAKRDSGWYVMRKTLRRYKAPAFTAAAFLVLGVAFGTTMTFMYQSAAAAERTALGNLQEERDFNSRELPEFFAFLKAASRRGPGVTVKFLADESAKLVATEFAGRPRAQASMRHIVAALYSNIEEHTAAERQLRLALATREATLDKDHPDVATTRIALGRVFLAEARYADAAKEIERALAIRKSVFGPKHESVAEALNDLGVARYGSEAYDQAEPLYVEALQMREELLGPNHADVAQSLNNLASLYFDKREYEKALPNYKRAIAIRRAIYGDRLHPELATSLSNLASTLDHLNRPDEANTLYDDALSVKRKWFGRNHSEVAFTLNSKATLLLRQERFEQAEHSYREALSVYDNVPEPDSNTARIGQAKAMRNIARTIALRADRLERSKGDADAAKVLRKESVKGYESAIGRWRAVERHGGDQLPRTLVMFGQLLTALGESDRAETVLREAVALREDPTIMDQDHPFLAYTRLSLGGCLVHMRKLEEAERLLTESFPIVESELGRY